MRSNVDARIRYPLLVSKRACCILSKTNSGTSMTDDAIIYVSKRNFVVNIELTR